MPDFCQNPVPVAGIGEGSRPSISVWFGRVSVSPAHGLAIGAMGNDPCPISATAGVTHARFSPQDLGSWQKPGMRHACDTPTGFPSPRELPCDSGTWYRWHTKTVTLLLGRLTIWSLLPKRLRMRVKKSASERKNGTKTHGVRKIM